MVGWNWTQCFYFVKIFVPKLKFYGCIYNDKDRKKKKTVQYDWCMKNMIMFKNSYSVHTVP